MSGVCSLSCWAKVVAWLQVIMYGLLLAIFIPVLLIGTDKKTIEITVKNATTEIIEEEQNDGSLFIRIVATVMVLGYDIIMFGFAFFLLRGIYKSQKKYVKVWLIGKGVLLALLAATILISVPALLFNIDSDLFDDIIALVVDSVMVWIIYMYYEEMKQDVVLEE